MSSQAYSIIKTGIGEIQKDTVAGTKNTQKAKQSKYYSNALESLWREGMVL